MNSISVAFKDLQIMFKDRGTLFQLFVLPLLFILVFSGALSAIGESEAVLLPVLAVVDLDGGLAAQNLIEKLASDGSLTVQPASASEAQSLVDENKAIGFLTIPGEFTENLQISSPVELTITTGSVSNSQKVESARLVIESIAADMTLESQITASLQQMGEMQADAPQEYQVFDTERVLAQAHSQFETSQSRPLIEVQQAIPQQDPEQVSTVDLSQSAVPGFTVLFVFMAAQTTARSIYDEKKFGTFRRLVAAPLNKTELMIGKILPNFITALVQILVIFAFGSIGMRLLGLTPMPVEKSPLGVILVAIVLALCSSAFGIAIAGIARTENQIGGLSTLLLWGMGLLGGSLIPLFILDRFLGPIPMIVPHYWANRAFDDLLIRSLGVTDIALDLAVLLAFSLLFFVIGLWRFDFEH
jgi:ABC-2 type transport system permease protein